MKQIAKYSFGVFFLIFLLLLINPGFGQDTTKVAPPDTVKITSADTTQLVAADTVSQNEKEDKKSKDAFILYIGGNLSDLSVSSNQYSSNGELGYQIGGSYRRGKFLYWGVGAKYNLANYGLQAPGPENDTTSLAVKSIDIPLTVGLDFLFFTSRVFTVRAFGSVVPSFLVGVTDETGLGIVKDDLNSFMVFGQGGVGFDVLFFVIDVGYNFGFQDLLKDKKSTPGQAFVNLGFRF